MQSILTILSLLFCVVLQAQNPGPTRFARTGIVVGVAMGASSIQQSATSFSAEQQLGLTFPNIKLGTMISSRTALLLYLPGTVYTYNKEGRKRDRGFEGIVPSVQFWATDRFWLLGGAGLGMDAPAFYDIKDKTERKFYFGTAALAGLGYEIWRKKRFAVDIQGRVHYGRIKFPTERHEGLAFSLLLGFNIY